MGQRGGARPNAGRKKKHIKIADVIRNHCEDFILELLKNEEINNRARREVQSLLEFEDLDSLKEDYLYIVKSNNSFKIGYTKDIKSRMNDYKIHFGLVEIVYVYKSFNCYELEGVIHNLVKDKNIMGEWFNLDDSDILSIISYCSKLIS